MITKTELEHLYIEERLSIQRVAEALNVTQNAVRWWIAKYGIPTRNKSEALKGNTNCVGRMPWTYGLTKKTDERVARMAEKLQGEHNSNFGRLAGENNPHFGKPHTEKAKRKIGDAQMGAKNHRFGFKYSEGEKAVLRQKSLELAKDPQYIAKLRQASLQLWQDPDWVRGMMLARQTKPNKLEQRFIDILTEHFPQYKYNGDFSQGVTLSGLIPDFVNVNGKKKVIELFGTFFHSGDRVSDWKRTELGKIMAYNSVGFDCLVIWDYELNDKTKILQKLNAFDRRRR